MHLVLHFSEAVVEELLILFFQPAISHALLFSHQNCPVACGDVDPHLTHGSLGPPESTDRQTHHATQSVTIGRTYIVVGRNLVISCAILYSERWY